MRVIGINGSPRKNWNTSMMVESALRGAADVGAETELYHLSDIDFKGCTSCFACIRLGAPTYGRCAYEDALKPILDDVVKSDGLIVGSPIYFHDLTAGVRAFLERLWFGGLSYNPERFALYEKRIPVKIILTTNVPDENYYTKLAKDLTAVMERFIGPTEVIQANDTMQFNDYSVYDSAMFDPIEKRKSRDERFPNNLEHAYEAGGSIIQMSIK